MKYNLSIGQCVEIACQLEVIAPKPGNVYPGAEWNFHDLTVNDLLTSANAISAVFDDGNHYPLGELILAAVQATAGTVKTNTNLGQILLIAPLVKTFLKFGTISSATVREILEVTTVDDAIATYRAIAQANPGGMGRQQDQDIREVPTLTLTEVMRIAASRDSIANQYSNAFHDVLEFGLPILISQWHKQTDWKNAVVRCHLHFMASIPDTLIARKCGENIALESAVKARQVLAVVNDSTKYNESLKDLDAWLRADANRRNPGATADLVTATLFVGLLTGQIEPPADLIQEIQLQLNH